MSPENIDKEDPRKGSYDHDTFQCDIDHTASFRIHCSDCNDQRQGFCDFLQFPPGQSKRAHKEHSVTTALTDLTEETESRQHLYALQNTMLQSKINRSHL